MNRVAARLIATIALLAASASWAGWLFLHTAGDPARSDRIARSVLDDSKARAQLSADISGALADAANRAASGAGVAAVVNGSDPVLQAAIATALQDRRVSNNVLDAIAAAHANALGVNPPRPSVIDTNLLVAAVRTQLGKTNPALARLIPTSGIGKINLPTARVPYAATFRREARTWVPILAAVAVAGLLLALALGDRARVVRRAGVWAVAAALAWVLLPFVISFAADRWAPGSAAIVRAVLRGATGPVSPTATILLVAGVVAIFASFLVPQLVGAGGGGAHRTAARNRGDGGSPGHAPFRPVAAPTWQPPEPTPPWPAQPATDTFESTRVLPEVGGPTYDAGGRLAGSYAERQRGLQAERAAWIPVEADEPPVGPPRRTPPPPPPPEPR